MHAGSLWPSQWLPQRPKMRGSGSLPAWGQTMADVWDIWAPGSDILSASHRSDRATEYRSGTSQAVPFVAGAAVLFLQNSSGAAL